MNVYDFDDTIYQGDSSKDYLIYNFKKHPRMVLCHGPGCIRAAAGYLLGKMDKKEMKEHFFSFLKDIDDPQMELEEFAQKQKDRVKAWYLNQQRADDVIVTASPEFMVKAIAKEVGISHVTGTRMDMFTGAIEGDNCKGESKIAAFAREYPLEAIEDFYSDSLSDAPLAAYAKQGYLVTKKSIEEWPKERKANG